jgi:hypothetical protein
VARPCKQSQGDPIAPISQEASEATTTAIAVRQLKHSGPKIAPRRFLTLPAQTLSTRSSVLKQEHAKGRGYYALERA